MAREAHGIGRKTRPGIATARSVRPGGGRDGDGHGGGRPGGAAPLAVRARPGGEGVVAALGEYRLDPSAVKRLAPLAIFGLDNK